MTKYLLSVAILGLFTACSGKSGDTGDTGAADTDVDTDTDTNVDTDTDTEPQDMVDSCNWPDLGICYEFTNYTDTEAWCGEIGTAYSITTEYMAAPCSTADVVGSCAIPAGGDFDVAATARYYASKFDAASAAESCTEGGGSPM